MTKRYVLLAFLLLGCDQGGLPSTTTNLSVCEQLGADVDAGLADAGQVTVVGRNIGSPCSTCGAAVCSWYSITDCTDAGAMSAYRCLPVPP